MSIGRLSDDVGRQHPASLDEPPSPAATVVTERLGRLLCWDAFADLKPEPAQDVSPRRKVHATPPSPQRCCDDSLNPSEAFRAFCAKRATGLSVGRCGVTRQEAS